MSAASPGTFPYGLVITSEHGGNSVPGPYRSLFSGAKKTLEGHRGWDPGSLEIARALSRGVGCPLIFSTTTRLLVDLNRTKDGAGRFSEFTRDLPADVRRKILAHHYRPHWQAVEEALRRAGRDRTVLHIGCHSFTPKPGRIGYLRPRRAYELGLLYDPSRRREKAFVQAWRAAILARDPKLQLRMNEPYRGTSNGMTTALRKKLGASYLGIELECNQGSLARPAMRARLRRVLTQSLVELTKTGV